MSQNPAIPSAESVARYFIFLAGRQRDPVPLTQMHLHKLLYYAQGWYLATRMCPIFNEELQAWPHGPVVAPLYRRFKQYGREAIPFREASDGGDLSADQRAVIQAVWLRLRRRSAAYLRNKTHKEKPWLEARDGCSPTDRARTPIPHESLKGYFWELHAEHCKKLGIDPVQLTKSLAQAARGEVVNFNLAAPIKGPIP